MACKEFKDICVTNFRHRIIIESQVRTPDGQGGFTATWSTFAERWSEIKDKKAQQVYFANQLQHQVSHQMIMRYVSGLKAEMRISFDGRIFEIREMIDVGERKTYHKLLVWENKQS